VGDLAAEFPDERGLENALLVSGFGDEAFEQLDEIDEFDDALFTVAGTLSAQLFSN
jgi:hypothetical protein